MTKLKKKVQKIRENVVVDMKKVLTSSQDNDNDD